MELYVLKNGETLGPLELAEVRHLLAAGKLLPTDLACLEGAPGWAPLSTLADAPPAHQGRRASKGGGGKTPGEPLATLPLASGFSREVSRLKGNTSVTAGELRAFMGELRGRSPKEMLGAIAQSTLVQGLVVSTAFFLLLFAASAALTSTPQPPKKQAAPAPSAENRPAEKSGTPAAAIPVGTTPGGKPKAITDVLGVGDQRSGKPKEINPFDLKDDLLKKNP